MKNNIRIWNVILLTAIYCLTISLATKSFVPNNDKNAPITVQEKHFSTTLFCDTSQLEISISNLNNFPSTSFEKLFNGFWTVTKTTEQLYKTVFTQYSNSLRNFLVKYRKSSIIFPFHYFW